MNLKFIISKLGLSVGAFFILVSISSCEFEEVFPDVVNGSLNVTVTEPVEKDFTDIKNRGTLRMITRYSSNTYFLHQGVEWGFEYELINEFADEHDLGLEVIIVKPDENPYDLLNSGEGDVIAANYTITEERDQYVKFTRGYNLVNQVLVFSDDVENPPQTIQELAESSIPVTIRRNSSYYNRLQELRKEGYDISLNIVPDQKDTESLLFDISNGGYQATIADDNILQASNKYMAGLVKGPTIAENDTIAWAIRENATELETELNRFLYKHFRFSGPGEEPKRSTFLNVLRKRYFEEGPQIAEYYNPEKKLAESGIISKYDEMIKSIADSAGVDWLMIASMVAQETKFNPNSESWAGAVGLMQVMPRFSEVPDKKLLYDEETNVREGVRIISEHLNHYAYMDSTNQWAFALATYNAGQGHLSDARRLVIAQNKNPNEWEPTADALLKLMQRKYYKNAVYGFCRGIETVRYVQEILNRYKTYESILAVTQGKENPNSLGILGIVN